MTYPTGMHNSGTKKTPELAGSEPDGDEGPIFKNGEPSVVRLGVPRSDSCGTPGRKA